MSNKTPGQWGQAPPSSTTPPKTTTTSQTTSPTQTTTTNDPTKKTTSQIMIEYEQELSRYGDELKKYKQMTPEQQAAYYPTIANLYNRASVIQSTFKDTSFQVQNYPQPNLNYDATKYQQNPQTESIPKTPAKDWRPPEIRGERPMEQLLSGASKLLRDNKLDALAWLTDALRNSMSQQDTQTQAMEVDLVRDVIGWASEANATWNDPAGGSTLGIVDLSGVGKLLKVITSPIGKAIDIVPRYGAAAVNLLELETRIRNDTQPRGFLEGALSSTPRGNDATKEELSMTPRERYEFAKSLAGTTEEMVSGVVDIAKAAVKTHCDMSVEAMTNWKWGDKIGFDSGDSTPTFFKNVSAELAYTEANKPALEAEFLRRYRDGDSPDLLAEELSDPLKELVAQIVYDPLNLLDFVVTPVIKGIQLSKFKQLNNVIDGLKGAGRLEDALALEDAYKVIRSAEKGAAYTDALTTVAKYQLEFGELIAPGMKASQMGKVRVKIPFTGMGKSAAKYYEIGGLPGRVIGKLSSTHSSEAMQGIKSVLNAIVDDGKYVAATDDVARGERAAEIILAMGRTGCGVGEDSVTYYNELAKLVDSKAANQFLSENGAKSSRIFSELLYDEVGRLDPKKLSGLKNLITDAMGRPDAVEFLVKKLATKVDDIFPSIGRRLEIEEQAVKLSEGLEEAATSKRVINLQKRADNLEKHIDDLAKTLKGNLTDEEWSKHLDDLVVHPENMPDNVKRFKKSVEELDALKDTLRQSTTLPRNAKFWSNNPVTDLEKLGWNVLEKKEELYNKFMPLLNRVYIKWNPGQWGRNFLTNTLHNLVDNGFDSILSPDAVVAKVAEYERRGFGVVGLLSAKKSILTGEEIAGTGAKLFRGDPGQTKNLLIKAREVFGNASKNVELLGNAQTYVSSVETSLNKVFDVIDRKFAPALKEAGFSDDFIRSFLVESRNSSPKEAAAKMLRGDNPRSALFYIPDSKDREVMQKLGHIDGLNNAVQPNNVNNDEVWDAVLRKHEDAVYSGDSIKMSQSPAGYGQNETAGAWLDATRSVGNEPHPYQMLNVYQYNAYDVARADTFKKLEMSGYRKLSGSKSAVGDAFEALCRGSEKSQLGDAAIERSKFNVKKNVFEVKGNAIRNKTFGTPQVQAEIDSIFFAGADEQYDIYQDTVDAMRNFLGDNGVDINEWESKMRIGMTQVDELYGDTVLVRNCNMDRFISDGNKVKYSNSPVRNAFTSRGIPLHSDPGSIYAASVQELGRDFSWKSLRTQLCSQGLDPEVWTLKKIAGSDFTPEEMKQLDDAVDAIAELRKARPKAGINRAAKWLPSTEWSEIPTDTKYIDPRLQIEVRDGKKFGRINPDSVSGTQSKIINDSIVQQTATDDELVEFTRLSEKQKELSKVSVGVSPEGNLSPLEKMDLENKIRDRDDAINAVDKEVNKLRAEIMDRYQRLHANVTPADTGDIAGVATAHSQQQANVKRIIEDVRTRAQADVPVMGAKYTPEQESSLWSAADGADQYMTDIRPTIAATARADMDFTMLNYDNRRGFDVMFGFIMPYHYWYSRTYWNWMQRIGRKPGVIAAYATYRKTLERIHADLPDYWKYSLNSNELFGMNSDSPLYFNLEATFNPMNGLTGVDFNDPDKSKGWFANMVQQAGKFGPSIHTPLLLGIGVAELLSGDREAAESWLGRLIPQTATLKAVTNLLGFDPQGKGGLEIDPMVLVMGGQGKYEIRGVQRVLSQFEAKGMLPDGTPVTHEDIIDAQYAGKGPLWTLASQEYNRQRAPGRIMSSIGGPGFQTRPQTDLYIDQFYTEVNDLYSRKGLMAPDVWSKAMSALYQKYPYANGLLMARKSGVARDEALIYDILNRIPPGQTTEYAEAMGIDPELIDRFYSKKGLTDDNGQPTMTEIETGRFLDSIRDLGSILAMPDTATRNEWRAAKQHYSEVFKQFSTETMQNVDMWYVVRGKDADLGRQYLKEHPEVQQYLEYKDQAIMNDDLLFRYYGGISFVESYYQRTMASHAEETWPDIEKIAMAYSQVQQNGGDTKAFLQAHPQLREYWNYVDKERAKIALVLEGLTARIPESPQASWRKDVRDLSVKATAMYESRMSMVPDKTKVIDAMALPYIPQEGEPVTYANFDFSGFLRAEAEKRWPGITALDAQYDVMTKKMQQATLYQHPELAEYQKWEKEMRRRYNAAKKSQPATTPEIPMTWDVWRPVFDPAVQRLVESYFTSGNISASVRKNLERTLAQAGITDVDSWLDQMRDSYRGYTQ